MNKHFQKINGQIIAKFLEKLNIKDPKEDYIKALNITIDTILNCKGKENGIVDVIPLPTGGGKSLITEFALSEYYLQNFSDSGTIIVKRRIEECNECVENINKITGQSIAITINSSNSFNIDDTISYPIVVVTHSYLQKRIKQVNKMKRWHQIDENGVVYNYERKRIIIDEAITLVNEFTISLDSLSKLELFLFKERRKDLYDSFTEVKMFFYEAMSNSLKKRSKIEYISSENFILPKEFEEVYIDTQCEEDFKAILNFKAYGGYVSSSSDLQYVKIVTASFVDVFENDFNTIVLDATAIINPIYNSGIFNIIDLPKIKNYENVTIKLFDKISCSKSFMNNNIGFFNIISEYIKNNLSDKKVLIVTFKDYENSFKEIFENNKNVFVEHYGNIVGTNKYRDCDCIVTVGVQRYSETSYVILYNLCSNDNTCHSKNTEAVTRGNKSRNRKFVDPDYDNMRISTIASELVQVINRTQCRNYNNGLAPKVHALLFVNEMDIIDKVKAAMPYVNIEIENSIDYEYKTKNTDSIIDDVYKMLKFPNEFFLNKKSITKSEFFNHSYLLEKYGVISKSYKHQIFKNQIIKELQTQEYFKINKHSIVFC